MAKVGEGDPRWIVTNREDGQNVNAWHWVEHNCLPVAVEAAHEAFTQKVLYEEKDDILKITKADVSGEATANNRKGKSIISSIYGFQLFIFMKLNLIYLSKLLLTEKQLLVLISFPMLLMKMKMNNMKSR